MLKKKVPQIQNFGETHVSAFGIEILRTIVIPELLGDETDAILYWSGKKLARHYLLKENSDLSLFFEQAGWGNLEVKEEKHETCTLILTSDIITARLIDVEKPSFALEAGFLAEQFEHFKMCAAETHTELKTGRNKRIEFQVKWDPKDPTEPIETNV